MRQLFSRARMWRRRELAPRYDIVIIGGGAHGLATAYYLARLGVARIAVLEMSYIGSGGSGRNTAIVRGNYRTPEGVPFYAKSVQMYERLAQELDYNLLFSQQGHLTLAHTDTAVTGLRIRAEVNQLMGVDSRLIWPEDSRFSRRSSPGRSDGGSRRARAAAAASGRAGGRARRRCSACRR